MEDFLESYITELLHINEIKDNKLINLNGNRLDRTLFIKDEDMDSLSSKIINLINEHYGKPGNTMLKDSALGQEQIVGKKGNVLSWVCADGTHDAQVVHNLIKDQYKNISNKGTNPLFLSVGALRWCVGYKDELVELLTPAIIFPIKLIHVSQTSPVHIEFVPDDIYFNPCLIQKMRQVLSSDVYENIPLPTGNTSFNDPIDLNLLGDGYEYFLNLTNYLNKFNTMDTLFQFDKNICAISSYNHDEICMYYDIRRNKDKIYNHPLVNRIFKYNNDVLNKVVESKIPSFVLPYDSVQKDIVSRIVNGESLVIKGPPGTGKTLTIANIVASLLDNNKKILFSSAKKSALSEVYAKLPKNLRKFCLKLDSESETQASSINPIEIRKDLKKILDYKEKEYNEDIERITSDLNHNLIDNKDAIINVNKYIDFAYSNSIYSKSLYEALDVYYKYDIPDYYIIDSKKALELDLDGYNVLLGMCNKINGFYNIITKNNKVKLHDSAWYGLVKNIDFDLIEKLDNNISLINKEIGVLDNNILNIISNMSLYSLLFMNNTEEEILNKIDNNIDISKIKETMLKFDLDNFNEDIKVELDDIVSKYPKLLGFGNKFISLNDIKVIYDLKEVFTSNNSQFLNIDDVNKFYERMDEISILITKMEYHLNECQKIVNTDIKDDMHKEIIKAYEALSKYIGDDEPKLGAFSFKAKKSYEYIKSLSYLDNVTLKEVVEFLDEYIKASHIKEEIDLKLRVIDMIFKRKLSKDEYDIINKLRKEVSKENFKDYILNIIDNYEFVKDNYDLVDLSYDKLIGEVLNKEYKILLYLEALECVKPLCDIIGKKDLKQALALVSYIDSKLSVGDYLLVNNLLNENVKNIIKDTIFIMKNLSSYFNDNIYINKGVISLKLIEEYLIDAKDKTIYGAVISFNELINTDCIVDFKAFFNNLDLNGTFTTIDAFEHLMHYSAIKGYLSKYNALYKYNGQFAHLNLDEIDKTKNNMFSLNAKLIENKLLNEINVEDPSFLFLAHEKDNLNIRKLFKQHPDGILKLKKCVILSPAAASLLFRPEEYDDFDVLIMDEASQVMPVEILPLLFRVKQCIIVGDEWQMPPIEHFKIKEVTIDEYLEPDSSVLSLALKNQAFNAKELICHYRSKTESLICFSQKNFYDNLRTFPAPVPKKDGLGFKTYFIPDANTIHGENIEEAKKVVDLLEEHFIKYYNPETKVLSESVGVVAFGVKQIECIKSLVSKNKELNNKITEAILNFGDNISEKLIFFKTIETVQGQEIDHLILSLTYGSKDGNTSNSFGLLNRDKLGKCIFNVAVTRAKASVSIVYSIKPEYITSERISYIKDYLSLAVRFSSDDVDPFYSQKIDRGFIMSVINYLISLGVDIDRIKYNYGVTNGSIRIPIAILNENKTEGLCGLWCEKLVKTSFVDYNLNYKKELSRIGWNLLDVNAIDWFSNNEAIKNNIKDFILKYVR